MNRQRVGAVKNARTRAQKHNPFLFGSAPQHRTLFPYADVVFFLSHFLFARTDEISRDLVLAKHSGTRRRFAGREMMVRWCAWMMVDGGREGGICSIK